ALTLVPRKRKLVLSNISNLTSKRVRLDSNKLKEKTFNFVAELKINAEKSIVNIKQQEKSDTQECNFQDNNTNNKTNWADESETTAENKLKEESSEASSSNEIRKKPLTNINKQTDKQHFRKPLCFRNSLESTDKSSTEIQEILQPVTETTRTETIQTGEFNPTEATAETNEMETTENKPEATNISTNNDLATDIETDFISHKKINNNNEKEFTLITSRKGKYKNKTKKGGYSPFTRVNKADKKNNPQRVSSPHI
ncbi:13929_t:CDS:2, partial [Racocetra persica]